MLQRHDLTPIPQRALREDPHLGQAVEDDACRLERLDPVDDPRRGLAEFNRGGLEHRQLVVRVEARLRGGEIEQLDTLQRPSVAFGNHLQFRTALRKADMQCLLSQACAFEEELQCQGGLPAARLPFDEVDAVGVQAATEDLVESRDPGRYTSLCNAR